MICTDAQIGPSAFWITNPNNTFIGNQAVDIGDGRTGVGYWLIFGGDMTVDGQPLEKDPTYINTGYWQDDFKSKKAGLVFNPSRTHYRDEFPWMIGQQQGRTPLKEFSGT